MEFDSSRNRAIPIIILLLLFYYKDTRRCDGYDNSWSTAAGSWAACTASWCAVWRYGWSSSSGSVQSSPKRHRYFGFLGVTKKCIWLILLKSVSSYTMLAITYVVFKIALLYTIKVVRANAEPSCMPGPSSVCLSARFSFVHQSVRIPPFVTIILRKMWYLSNEIYVCHVNFICLSVPNKINVLFFYLCSPLWFLFKFAI